MAKKLYALRSLLFAKSPSGRHNDSDGGVSPSKNVSPVFFPFHYLFRSYLFAPG